MRKSRLLGFAALALAASTTTLVALPGSGVLAADAPAAAAKRIPSEEFVKKSNMRSPRISPDGRFLAYFAGAAGREMVVLMDLANPGNPPKPIIAAEEVREAGDRTVVAFRWVGSGHVVLTTQERANFAGQLGDYSRLVAYSVASGKLITQAWDKSGFSAAQILWIDHKKGEFLLQRDTVGDDTERNALPEVIRVNVATGQYSIVQRKNPIVTSWYADSDGVVRGGYSRDRDSGKLRVVYRSNEKEAFRTVYNAADSTFTESPPEPKMFIPGTDTAYVLSNKDDVDRVYIMNMETLELSGPVFETPGFDVEGLITDFPRRNVIGYRTFNGYNLNVYTNPRFKELQGFLEEMFGKGEAIISDMDESGNRLIVYGGGSSKGGGFFLYDVNAGKISLLNWRHTAIADSPLNPTTAEWITASDGVKMQVMVTMPRHRTGKNLPVVVMPHGGPFGATDSATGGDPWAQALAEAGYVVLQPNYRGSGGYGKAFIKKGRDPGGYGKRMQDDLTDTLNAFAAKGLVDPKRACIMGWSYGGYAAARGAQRDPQLWRCAIAGAGVYDMPLMHKWDAQRAGRFIMGFQATSDDPEGISSALHTDGPWAPLLIVAPERDARIPMEQSRTLVANLKRSGKVEGTDFRYVIQPKGTHDLPYDDVHMEWINEALAWLARFNPAYLDSDSDKPV